MYEMLYKKTSRSFKVRVEFDEEMPMSDGVIAEYAGRLRTLSEKEGLYPIAGRIAAMLEYGVRKAGRRNKVTARFIDIADLAREKAHYAAAAATTTLGMRWLQRWSGIT